MSGCRRTLIIASICYLLSPLDWASSNDHPRLLIKPGDRIAVIGNTMAERMQYFGHFETLLQSRFPDYQLVVRNLGWSADQLAFGWGSGKEENLFRSKDFADHGHRLADHRPSVILACFGLNESFGGPSGLNAFREQLRGLVDYLTKTKFDGIAPPRVVLVTPIPHEDLRRPEFPDGAATNANLELYVGAMKEVAAEMGVLCVDVFHLLQATMAEEADFTINGVHLNEAGDKVLGEVLDAALFGDRPAQIAADLPTLRKVILEKNQQFFFDYRAVNGYYIYGGRKAPFGIVNFPAEFAKLRRMIERREAQIWEVAKGKPVAPVDDEGTGEFTEIESNVSKTVRCLTPQEQQQTFHLAKGFVAELYASEEEFPELANPCQFAFDGRGRMWVCTMPTYPMYLPGQPPHDRVIILEDRDRDGRADQCSTFADGLHLPTGIELGDGGAYVAQQPNLMFLGDDDGDGKADRRELILHGFDSADSHHSISTFTWGPSGELYFQEGTFHHSQIETPRGPVRVKDAAVFRFEPQTHKLDVYISYPFANPWGHCFDPWGQDFVADASNGFNYFAAAFSGNVVFPQKHRRMETFLVKQWRPTAGCTLVSSPNFPEEMQGDFLITNCIGFQGVLQYRMRDEGSGFAADPVEPLFSSTDPACRPIDLKFGPDGALYFCDWYNPLVGHMQHNLRDPKRDKQHGRIWRIRHADRPLLSPPSIEGAPLEDLFKLLESDVDQHRYLARIAIRSAKHRKTTQGDSRQSGSQQTKRILAALEQWLDGVRQRLVAKEITLVTFERAQLEALWIQQYLGAVQPELLEKVLTSPEPRARAAGVRALCYLRDEVPSTTEKLVRAAEDPHPRVRLEAVRAASFLEPNHGETVLQAAVKLPLDYYLQYTMNETAATLELRGGRPGGAAMVAVERLAEGSVSKDQVLPLVQLSIAEADARSMSRLLLAVAENPNYSAETKIEVIGLLRQEAAARKLSPPLSPGKLLAMTEGALQENQPTLAASILSLAEAWQIPGMVVELQKYAIGTEVPTQVAHAAFSALAADPSPSAWDAIREITASSTDQRTLLQASAALADRNLHRSLEALLKALRSSEVDFAILRPAVDAVLRQQGGARELTKAIGNHRLNPDSAKLLLRATYAVGSSDAKLAAALTTAAGIHAQSKPLTVAEKAKLVQRIEQEGDPHAGELIYRRNELSCQKCHGISGAGGNIGPDLNVVGANSPIDYLIDSILLPSQQIKEAFITRRVLTSTGQVITGIRVDGNDKRIILRDAEGKEITIPTEDIDSESDGPSLMPEGLHNLLTERELVDLIKFLSVLGKPGEFGLSNRPLARSYHVLADATIQESLAKAEEGKMEQMLSDIPTSAWQPRLGMTDGRWLKEDAVTTNRLPLILRTEVKLAVPGELAVRVSPVEDVQVVVGGQSISARGEERISVKAGVHSVYLIYEKPPKWNALTVELDSR